MRMARRVGMYGNNNVVLFDGSSGGDKPERSGGWIVNNNGDHTCKITVGTTTIDCYHPPDDGSSNNATATTTNTFDLTYFRYVKLTRTRTTGWGGSSSPYAIPSLRAMNGSTVAANVSVGPDYAEQTITLDVSNLTGTYAIQVFLGGGTGISKTINTYITKIWIER